MSGGTQMSQDSTIPEDAPAPIPEETNSAANTTQTNMDAPRRPLDSRLVSFHDAAPEGLTGPDGNPPTLAALAVAETAVKVASTNHFTTTANSFENHSASNLGAANASDATTANSTAYSGAPDSAKASERARKPPDNEGLGGPDDDDDNENETINNKRKNKIVDKSPTGRYVRFNDLLGEGAFKKVYRAYDTTQGVEVAWNQVKVSRMSPAARQRVVQEMKILQELDHPSIIHFFSSFLNKDAEAVVFITEMMASGTLKEFIQNRPVLLRIVKRWCRHILHALIYLHDHDPPIIHRDLKCDNIFINGSTGDIRIGDLGLASWQRQGAARTVLGTPEYMAPEMFEELYDEQVDIYAFGMCVLEMITKETPFMECQSAPQIYKKVIAGITPACFDRVIEGPAKDFIFQCIKMRPAGERRPSAQELRKDPFLQKRDDPADDIDCQELLKSDVAPTDKRSDSLGSLPRGTAELPMPPTQEYSRSRSRRDSSPVHPRNTEEPPSSAGYGEEPRSTKSMMSAKSTGSPTETEEDRSETSGMKLSSVRESSNTHQKAPLSPKSDTEVHEFPMTASPNLGPSAVFDDNASVGAVSLPPPSTSPVPNGSSSVHSTDTAPPSSTVIPPNMMQDRTQGASMPPPAAPGTAKKTRVMIGRGISVEARFNGEGEWYPGKIQDLNNDSTIAIKYNDQRFEPRVSADLIRVRADDGRTFILADVLKQPRKTLDNGDIQPAENTVQALDGSHRKVLVVPVSPISPGEVMSPRTADQGHQSLGIGSRSTSTGTGFAGAPETTGNVVKNAPQQQQMAPPQQIQPPPPQQQQQQQQQAPMLAPGRRTTPVPPSSQAQGSRPATAQSAKMQQPHSQQAPPGSADVPQPNNDPRSTLKRQVSTTSLTSQASSAYALGTYWRIICTGPMENQSPDQLNIRFTLRDTVTKTKQTAQFCYDLNSDEPGALATELIDEMRIAATEHDTIAQKFASFVQEYRRYRETPPSQPGSPKEPFRLAAEQKSLPAALAGMSAGVSGVSGIVNNPATLSPSMGPGTSQTPPLAQFQHPQQRQPTIPGQPQQQQQQYQQQQTPMAQQAPQQAQQQYQQQLPKAQQQQQLPRPPMPSGEFEGTDIFLGMPPAVFGESQQDLAAFDRLLDEEKVRYEEFHAEYKRKIDEINKLREMAQRQTQTVQSGQANGVNGGGGYVSNTPEGNLPHVENSDNMAEPEAASVGVMPPPPTRQILFHPNELALVSADTDLIDPDPDDQSEEARQWRRLLAEHRQRQKKEMIKLQKAREAAAAEKKLFDVDNLSLSEDGNKSKTNTSLKEQMRQRSLAGYPRLSSEGSNSSFTLNAAGPGAAVPPTAAAINHGSTSGMVIAGMLGQSVTSQQQPPLMVSATTTTQPYFLGDSSAVQGFVQTSSQPFQEPLTASHMPALHNQIQGQPQLSQPPQQQSLNQVPQAAPAAPQQPQQQQQQQQPQQQQQQQQPQQPQQQQQQQQQPQQPQPTQPQHAQQPQGQLGQPQIVPPSQVASVHPSTVPASQQ